MDYFVLLKGLKLALSTYSLSKTFVNKTADVIEQIGLSELRSALNTMNDANLSSCPEKEIESAITQLRLSCEKIGDDNIKKIEVLLLIAMLYYSLNQFDLSKKFREDAISSFDLWLKIVEQCWLGIPEKKYLLSNNSPDDVKYLGMEWKGAKYASLASKIVSLFDKRTFNDRFRDGIRNAKLEFRDKVYQLFNN